jgi:gramicidin S synthase 2
VWQGETVSYRELDERSGRIAAELSAKGIGTGSIIPIRQERGAEWFAYSLGILKAGAAYVPISPSIPAERLNFILRDCESNTAPPGAFCVYYTSGNTGVPKGVILSNNGVVSLCETHCALFGFSHAHGSRAAIQADVGFDSFLLSSLPTLCTGGTLYLMNDAERASLVGIHRFMMKNKIETTFLTTRFAVEYMRSFDNKYLKILLTGGEALHSYTPRSYEAYNIYGPIECTAYITAHKLRDGDTGDIPIGTPIGQNRISLIDGEICVSGPQVAFGYLGYPPFGEVYHTGDLAEWTDSGELLYRGRLDNMVKISGYRIEPGEVEVTLEKHPGLSAVCVAVKRERLTAYCVPSAAEDENVTPDALKAYLAERLPSYILNCRQNISM